MPSASARAAPHRPGAARDPPSARSGAELKIASITSARPTSRRPGLAGHLTSPRSTPPSTRRRSSATAEMTIVPTTAPARLVIPPITSITTIRKVMLRKNASGLNEPMNMPSSAPATPTKNAETTNASRALPRDADPDRVRRRPPPRETRAVAVRSRDRWNAHAAAIATSAQREGSPDVVVVGIPRHAAVPCVTCSPVLRDDVDDASARRTSPAPP